VNRSPFHLFEGKSLETTRGEHWRNWKHFLLLDLSRPLNDERRQVPFIGIDPDKMLRVLGATFHAAGTWEDASASNAANTFPAISTALLAAITEENQTEFAL
jgi:hypothetical protein